MGEGSHLTFQDITKNPKAIQMDPLPTTKNHRVPGFEKLCSFTLRPKALKMGKTPTTQTNRYVALLLHSIKLEYLRAAEIDQTKLRNHHLELQTTLDEKCHITPPLPEKKKKRSPGPLRPLVCSSCFFQSKEEFLETNIRIELE